MLHSLYSWWDELAGVFSPVSVILSGYKALNWSSKLTTFQPFILPTYDRIKKSWIIIACPNGRGNQKLIPLLRQLHGFTSLWVEFISVLVAAALFLRVEKGFLPPLTPSHCLVLGSHSHPLDYRVLPHCGHQGFLRAEGYKSSGTGGGWTRQLR